MAPSYSFIPVSKIPDTEKRITVGIWLVVVPLPRGDMRVMGSPTATFSFSAVTRPMISPGAFPDDSSGAAVIERIAEGGVFPHKNRRPRPRRIERFQHRPRHGVGASQHHLRINERSCGLNAVDGFDRGDGRIDVPTDSP